MLGPEATSFGDLPAELERAVAWLREGKLVAAATESSFALLADASSAAALDLLFRSKGRDGAKGVGLIAPDRASWRSLVREIPPLAGALAEAFWPGPLTLVLPAAAGTDPRITQAGTVGIRVPGASAAADIARAFGGALSATSANLAGEPPCCDAAAVRSSGLGGPETLLVLEGQAPGGPPSTYVRVEAASYTVLRSGAIAEQELARVARRMELVR